MADVPAAAEPQQPEPPFPSERESLDKIAKDLARICKSLERLCELAKKPAEVADAVKPSPRPAIRAERPKR